MLKRALWVVVAALAVASVAAEQLPVAIRMGRVGPTESQSGQTPNLDTASPLTSGSAGTAYSTSFSCSGGTAPYTYAVTSGTLPPGTELSLAGALTGTPTAAGNYVFLVRCTDAKTLQSPALTYQLTIGVGVPEVTTSSPMTSCTQNSACSRTFGAQYGQTPYAWTLSTAPGSIPPGMTLSTDGVLSGTPTTAGAYTFTVRATDALAGFGEKELTLTVTPAGTGACDGPAADDWFDCMSQLNPGAGGSVIAYQLRSFSQLDQFSPGDPPPTTSLSYCYAGNTEEDGSGSACTTDPYSDKQNAAKIVLPQGTNGGVSTALPNIPINKNNGYILIAFDFYSTSSWKLGEACATSGTQQNQKKFMIMCPGEQNNTGRCLEYQERYLGVGVPGGTSTQGSVAAIPGFNGLTAANPTGTDVAGSTIRNYCQMQFYGSGGSIPYGNADPIPGMVNSFIQKVDVWTRYVAVIKMNAGQQFGPCGTVPSETLKADLFSLWMLDEAQGPTRLYNDFIFETLRVNIGAGTRCDGDETFHSDGITSFQFRFNHSSGSCTGGNSQDRIGYFKNFVAVHSITGAISVNSATSVTVNGTEVLVRPKAE
jgi:hypothetical protein